VGVLLGRRRERGAVAVEFALVLPLLLLLVLGGIDWGYYFFASEVITNVAREGASVAVLPGYTDAMVTSRVQQYIQAGVLDANVTPTITIQRSVAVSYGSGTATGSKVIVSYPFHFIALNGIARLIVSNTTVGSDFTMAASATMRNEN